MRINFQDENVKKLKINNKLISTVIITLILILILTLIYLYNYNQLLKLTREAEKSNQELSYIYQVYNKYNYYTEKIDEYINIINTQNYEYIWDDLLKELGDITPEAIIITELIIEKNKFILSGTGNNSELIMEFTENLRKSSLFKKVELPSLNKKDNYHFKLKGGCGYGTNKANN